MRVLQVAVNDLVGQRFNGFDLIEPLRERGVECYMAVLNKRSDEAAVHVLSDGLRDDGLRSTICALEDRYGMNGVLHPWGAILADSDVFRSADVVHYHQVHNQLISVLDLPRLFAEKPSVWTLHDSWALTGHCVQPCGCEEWRVGCEFCPRPELRFELDAEHSRMMWNLKRSMYSRMEVELVVATEHMLDRVNASPLGQQLGVPHLIPFGVDSPNVPDRASARAALGISAESFVIMVRIGTEDYRGLKYFVEALSLAPPARTTCIAAISTTGQLTSLESDYDVRDFGWVEGELHAQLLAACDVFVAPYSWAVGFGLVAVEAMSAARAVVCFDDTSIASVTRAPDIGVAVRNCDPRALRGAIDRLMGDQAECDSRGRAGLALARGEYGKERYVERMLDLYEVVAQR